MVGARVAAGTGNEQATAVSVAAALARTHRRGDGPLISGRPCAPVNRFRDSSRGGDIVDLIEQQERLHHEGSARQSPGLTYLRCRSHDGIQRPNRVHGKHRP
jgi:hypothetical protein